MILETFIEWALLQLGHGPMTTAMLYERAPRAWSLSSVDVDLMLGKDERVERCAVDGKRSAWRVSGRLPKPRRGR